MTKLSKRAQVEQLGWRITAIPFFWEEGRFWHIRATGQKSPAHYDYERPEGWIVTPPEGFPSPARRFDGSSPNAAVRWAYDQATAPRLKHDLGGVAALVVLMGEARRAGVVADAVDDAAAPPSRPDAELLNLCGEVMGADRIADIIRKGDGPCVWTDKPGHQRMMAQLSEACRTQDRLLPHVVELRATTAAGVVAKAQAIALLFATSRGKKADAVRALVADLVAVLGAGADTGRVSS